MDQNVTRHVPTELLRDDWNAMILHYLGLDHIGHKAGPTRYAIGEEAPIQLPSQSPNFF